VRIVDAHDLICDLMRTKLVSSIVDIVIAVPNIRIRRVLRVDSARNSG